MLCEKLSQYDGSAAVFRLRAHLIGARPLGKEKYEIRKNDHYGNPFRNSSFKASDLAKKSE